MKPLNMYIEQSNRLRQLISEFPDYPIMVCVDSDLCSSDYTYSIVPTLDFKIGEFLDCDQNINDEKVYLDRDDFEEDLRDVLADSEECETLFDEEFDGYVTSKLEEYEPYWKNVILIMGYS